MSFPLKSRSVLALNGDHYHAVKPGAELSSSHLNSVGLCLWQPLLTARILTIKGTLTQSKRPKLCLSLDTENPHYHYGYINYDKMDLRWRPEVHLCLSVGQTDPGVESVEHQTKMERWGKVQKIKGNVEILFFFQSKPEKVFFVYISLIFLILSPS